jgi:outer membrane protein, heavy metal efflux system
VWLLAGLCMREVGAAEFAPTSAELTLQVAVNRAVERNPDLAQFAFRLRSEDARIRVAALKPPLEFGAQLENVLGSGAVSGFDGAELTFSLSQVVELGAVREHRVDAARFARDRVELSRQAAQLDTLAEVGRRFVHVAADQQQLELTKRASQLAAQTVSEVERRVNAARSPEVELTRARIALQRAGLEEEHAEHELLTSRRALAAMWGAREADFGLVSLDLFRLPTLPDEKALVARLAGTPDFLVFATEARQRDAELQLALARARPALSWNAGVRRLQRDGDVGLVAGFSMPLQSARRAEPGIALARAERARVDQEVFASQVRAEASLFGLVQELRHAITETRLLRDEILPQYQGLLDATRHAWERGRYGYLEWTDAQREHVEVQRTLIEAAARAQQLQMEIERLTGAPLAPNSSENQTP